MKNFFAKGRKVGFLSFHEKFNYPGHRFKSEKFIVMILNNRISEASVNRVLFYDLKNICAFMKLKLSIKSGCGHISGLD